MLIRESNCQCCNTVWFPPSSWSSVASPLTLFARVFTITAPYFYQRTVSLLQKALHYRHQCMSLGCSFAGQWALLPVPQRPGGCGGVRRPNAAPCVQRLLQRCSFAVSDVELLCWQRPQADSFLAKWHSVWYVFLLAATEISRLFFISYFFSLSEEYFRASQAVG